MIGAVLRLTDNSEPVAGAIIEALVNGAVCGQAVTDANGAFEIAANGGGTPGGCGSSGGELTFRVNGDEPVRADKHPRGNTTMVLLFVQ
ncbi:MAG: hypothetical protein ACRDJ9_09085 [Dehalococcoidia bacterium]